MGRHLDALCRNILLHPAHHVDSRIPWYHLPAANDYLKSRGVRFVTQKPGLREILAIVRSCKLYDYERSTWKTFPRNLAG